MMDNELLRFDRLAASVARRIAPPRAASPPQPTRSPLFSLLLLREWLRLTYQDFEDLLRLFGQLRRVFGLRVVLDTATVWRFPPPSRRPRLLDAALDETVRRVRGDAEGASEIALDSIGLFLAHIPRLRVAREAAPGPARLAGMNLRHVGLAADPATSSVCRLRRAQPTPASLRATHGERRL